jgi:hypothetical protein
VYGPGNASHERRTSCEGPSAFAPAHLLPGMVRVLGMSVERGQLTASRQQPTSG